MMSYTCGYFTIECGRFTGVGIRRGYFLLVFLDVSFCLVVWGLRGGVWCIGEVINRSYLGILIF